jgi:hypothetical protein
MSRIIELPDELYRDSGRARERRLTPADWIATALPGRSGAIDQQRPSELVQGLFGAVDSTKERRSSQARTPFGEMIARKFKRQGLRGE